MNGRYLPLLGGALCLAGCVVEPVGPAQHDFRAVERDNSELVRVNLHMGAGNLRVDTGTDKLVAADFTYNVPAWKPEVTYDTAAGRGSLTIRQPETSHPHIGRTDYEWDLRFNRQVPLDLAVDFGAGEAHLEVGGLSLRGVDVNMGVGKLDLDLRGRPAQSYTLRIRGGVGEATVRVPAGVGVEAEAEGGIGEITTVGMRKEGRRYVNEAYPDAKTTIHLDIHGGVGSIHLICD